MKTALVIGSGISGLAIACYLAKAGYRVQLYEKNNQLGGRSSLYQEAGYTFDMGPSWYLMPEVFESFFSYFGKKTSDYYESDKLDPAYRIFFSDQDFVDISTKLEENVELFESLEVGAGARLIEYISLAKEEYALAIGSLIQKNYDSLRDLFSLEGLRFIAKSKNFISYESYVKRYFSSPKLQKILLYTSVFLGGSPKNTPALYSLINHCDFNDGVYFPKGGIYSIVQAFVSLAEELGVEMHTNSEVKKILIEDGRATGIELESGEIRSDIVVSSGDYHHADQVLIDPEYRQYTEKQWESMTLSPSGFILYLGIHKKIPALQHHTLFFDPDWDNHFDSIYKEKTLCDTPSYYVSCVTKTDPSVAPDGCEAVFIFVPTATGLELSEGEKNKYADKIISGLSRAIGEDLAGYIDIERIYTGDDFSKDYFAFGGNALGLAHTFRQTLTLRPKNKHPKVAGLYFTGHYTTPGTGMPMVLISSKLVKDKILADYNNITGIPPVPVIPAYLPTGRQVQESRFRDKPGMTEHCSIKLVYYNTSLMGSLQQSLFKKSSKTFYYSTLFFPNSIRSDIYDLYAFVRTADDYVDTLPQDREAFYRFRDDALAAIDHPDTRSPDPIIAGFVDVYTKYHFRKEWVESFLGAMESDLSVVSMTDRDALEQYMYGSAAVVGYMMCAIFSIDDPASLHAAKMLAYSMQSINFIRDVAEDNELGRKYLYDIGGIHYDRLILGDEHLSSFIHLHLENYHTYLREAQAGLHALPLAFRVPVMTASDMYAWTARVIEKDPWIIFERKIKPSKGQIMFHAIRNFIREGVGPTRFITP